MKEINASLTLFQPTSLIEGAVECSHKLASGVIAASKNPIRKMPEAEFVKTVMTEVFRAAEAYAGADASKTSTLVFAACEQMLREQFAEMGAADIRIAFQLAASKQIDANLAAYRGQFTAEILGSVLTAYRTWRRGVLAKAAEAEREMEREQDEAKRRKRGNQTAESTYREYLRLCEINDRWAVWTDVPAGMDRVLANRGAFDNVPKTTKASIWLAAKDEAIAEAKRAAVNQFVQKSDREAAKKIVQQFDSDPGFFPELARPRAEVIYGKMLIFHTVASYHSARTEPELAEMAETY